MSNKNVSTSPLVTVGRQALEDAPSRALLFLRAVSTHAGIRSALHEVGYTKRDHEEGWSLFFAITKHLPEAAARPGVNHAEEAVVEIQAWQGPGFLRARAALRRKHPDQERFVFDGLAAGRGAEAIGAMAVFLERVEALQSAPERKATRKADHAALETLGERGITKAVLARLRERVTFVSKNEPRRDAPATPNVQNAADFERVHHLAALYAWLQDWSDTARAVVTRRDERIRLGLARRRTRRTDATPVVKPDVVADADDAGPSSRAA